MYTWDLRTVERPVGSINNSMKKKRGERGGTRKCIEADS
jgi:hypothetical protein